MKLKILVAGGRACIAALKTNRKYVAYNVDKAYCDLAERRIKQFLQEQTTLFSQKNLPPSLAEPSNPPKAD